MYFMSRYERVYGNNNYLCILSLCFNKYDEKVKEIDDI